MNKEDLKALLSIAKKQDWNGKPAAEFITETLQFSEDMGMNLSDIDALLYITSTEECTAAIKAYLKNVKYHMDYIAASIIQDK